MASSRRTINSSRKTLRDGELFVSIPPPFKEKFTKLAMMDEEGYNQDWEVVFQTVRAPLSAFQPAGNSKVFDPLKLRIVRLKFDRTPIYKICISSIGFSVGSNQY